MRAAARHGERARSGAADLLKLMSAASSLDESGQVQAVNAFFNDRLQFADDQDTWGQADYWASPLESLQRGRGDCEDYAIAKYFTLLGLGIPPSRLRLVYARAAAAGSVIALISGRADPTAGRMQSHMVLAYYPPRGGEPQVLDNLIDDIRPALLRPDLTPVFSFNQTGLWEGVGTVSVGGAGPVTRLARWRDVIKKAKTDGFFP